MRLCVFGRTDDPLSDHTEAVARARGHSVLRVPLGKVADGAPVAWSSEDGAWLFGGEPIDACDAFVVRQYPAVHALLAPPDTSDTAAGWFQRSAVQVERSSFAQSVIMDLEQRGKPTVNPLFASTHWDHKPLQLAALQRANIPVPRTLVTNFPEGARIFVDDLTSTGAIVKPLAGGAEAQLVNADVRARLDAIASSPVILQELIEGPDVRVTVVGDRVLSSVVIESSTLDYRSGAAYRTGGAAYVAHALPTEIAAMCVRIAGMFSHVLSGIDLKRTPTGYVVIEANSGPVYLDIEHKTGAPITEAIVEWLERASA